DKDEVEDDASIEEIEDMEEDFSVPNSIYEIVIPKILSTFSVYGILSIDEELVFWKSKDQVNEDELIRNGRKLSVNERPEIIELNTEPEVYYLMSKNEILIKEELLGYYFVGKDVTVAYETMDNLLKILLMSFIVGLFISAFLGYIVAGRSIAPIKKAYESKQDFLANVSHELRTPLSVILLSTETLDGDIDGKETFQHEIVSDIKEETKKMSGLIEKLLLLSRSDSHKLVTTKENFSFTELVEREINNFRALGGSKNIVIEDQLQDGVICFGDKRLLSSVVTVLLDNSIKYNRDNGKVFVLLNNHESKGVKEIELVVRDTGIGIPEKDYEHVFERFYRLENSRSKKTGGYGLGLSIAKEIVELHHGSITLLSKLGEGSEFTVRLPKS
ncbi:MAG: HAMP domain-containing histidine kinase, partial [Vallitaleaceae bacterium]|nr:HAMP domain-containing histidine kinase [Vallitaleaceae bacterium]